MTTRKPMRALPSRKYWDEEAEDLEQHPDVTASDQIAAAIRHIDRVPESLMRWPFPALDALTGPMGGGEVWFTAAYSGGGKTTFVVSAVEAWRQQGKRIYVMPLELAAPRFRTYLGCMQTGTPPGDALSGQLRADPARNAERERLKEAVYAQHRPEFMEHVRISEQQTIDVAGLAKGFREAKRFNADIVIVDHIDHIEGGDGSNLYAESYAVNNAALRMAQDNDLLVWFTSQLNMEIGKGRDHLAKYSAPMQHHLMFPTAKIKNATGIIGLYRPLRAPLAGEGGKEYAAAIKALRAGQGNAADALEPGVMGVSAMKLRNYGQHDGKKITLGFERGRVVSLDEKDRYTTGSGYIRKVI